MNTNTAYINDNSNWEDKSVISIYLKEINKIPLLTREEEDEISRKAVKGDKAAQEKLINANLRFVVNVAKKYQNQGLPLDDLINEGNIGLINAINKFDPDKGYHFISYAVWWIRQSILKAICEKSRMIRLPLNRSNELLQIEKKKRELTSLKGIEPENEEIARELHLSKEIVDDLLSISRDMVSLDTPVYTDRDSSNLGDFIEDQGLKLPEDEIIDKSLAEDINNVLTTLSQKEAEILQFRFGLNHEKPLSLKQIGDKYNLTKERIRQIEKKAISRLQHPSRKQLLEAYVA
ncbi:sigma-70 family RNA polymerase sigma factor [Spirochaeta isovalerica]|uniref:RNA polymerase primary sigma factor n=1 Tax=Spirochaeta isovalerica TaxID=150 RepID=A0A841R6V8_9SPIO|nr:RNA polymerase sigma factor RpoD/SigA [Spirochaeta isovalerica]MBB6478780.1 RNA polymerase primary sigma factor [Spirochaeta isovalerica]